ncbi:MAG: type II toxin-antitoxin system RelE/ParE family toxin [Desulfobacterales bacterium]|nr:type II toxin-antitoxin system RelE/ParE family toxin [Desulfobacterales bacterium]
MASFEIRWKQSAGKELKKLPQSAIGKILSEVEALVNEPIPVNAVKLSGAKHTYRIRVGNYRLVYNVLNRILTIEVIRVGHRKDVYRNLP